MFRATTSARPAEPVAPTTSRSTSDELPPSRAVLPSVATSGATVGRTRTSVRLAGDANTPERSIDTAVSGVSPLSSVISSAGLPPWMSDSSMSAPGLARTAEAPVASDRTRTRAIAAGRAC